jgi:hypothetical protein
MELLVDAYNGGELTALQDAEEVLSKLTGYQVRAARRVRGACVCARVLRLHACAGAHCGRVALTRRAAGRRRLHSTCFGPPCLMPPKPNTHAGGAGPKVCL